MMRLSEWMNLLVLCVFAAVWMLATPARSNAGLLENITLTNMDLSYTSGTLVLQEIHADKAVMSTEGESIISDNVTIRMPQEKITVESPLFRYYFATPKLDEENIVQTEPSKEELMKWREDLARIGAMPTIRDASRGDFVLADPNQKKWLTIDMGEQGKLKCRNLIWSERYQKFISIGQFEQVGEVDGDVIETTGSAFTTNRNFSVWHYPVVDGQPVTMKFKGTAE